MDGVIPQDTKQAEMLWHLREGVAAAAGQYGYTLKYDVSLPAETYYQLVRDARKFISTAFSVEESQKIKAVGYGHVGDGNLHLNISLPGYQDENLQKKAYDLIDEFVMGKVREYKGSISAEHGIGQQKAKYLHYSKTKEMIETMKLVKQVFDPNGILNPYKVLI